MSRRPDPETVLAGLIMLGLVASVAVFGAAVSPAAADSTRKKRRRT